LLWGRSSARMRLVHAFLKAAQELNATLGETQK
jgi:hypothetical protein